MNPLIIWSAILLNFIFSRLIEAECSRADVMDSYSLAWRAWIINVENYRDESVKGVWHGMKSSMETKRFHWCLASGLKAGDTHLRMDGFGMKGWGEVENALQAGNPIVAGGLKEMKKNTSHWFFFFFLAGREKEGPPVHLCKRLQPTVSLAPLSDKKAHHGGTREERGLTVGWPLATLMMRLSCTLLPYRAFPVWSEFLFFFLSGSIMEVHWGIDVCK